jgi:hypothetical protein
LASLLPSRVVVCPACAGHDDDDDDDANDDDDDDDDHCCCNNDHDLLDQVRLCLLRYPQR